MSEEIRPLMGVRALAAWSVALFHAAPILVLVAPSTAAHVPLIASALLAVDFFFMLSGFVLTLNYLEDLGERPSRANVVRFWMLRFARIWPVHAVMVVAFVAYDVWSRQALGYGLSADNTGVGNVLSNLAMTYEIPPGTAINPPAWSLAPEVGAYLAFPVLALGLARIRTPAAAFGAAAVVCGLGALLLWRLWTELGADQPSYTVAWLRIVVSFPTGCLLAVGWRRLRWWQRQGANWDLAAGFAMAATLFIAYAVNREGEVGAPVAAYPFLALLVVACAGSETWMAQALGNRFVHWCGQTSYSLYLTHFLVVIAVYGWLVRHDAGGWPPLGRLVVFPVVLLLVFGVGTATYHLVEEPARRAIRARAPVPVSPLAL